jgi:hypothetical protein
MKEAVFSYQRIDTFSMMPIIPLRLEHGVSEINTEALIDSGASVNVMPYQIGLDLGLDWNTCPVGTSLAGNLSAIETRLVVVQAFIADLSKVKLGFVWVKSDHLRLLLGQNNFFKNFSICFSATKLKILISEEEV